MEKPNIQDNEILIQVHAASVNPVDWKVRSGKLKLLTGIKPPGILGGDYAGVVVEVGKKVTNYQIGDEVWGMINAFKGGTYAEYLKVKIKEIGPKPENLNFEEASSIPLAGLTAYQSLVYLGHIKEGNHVIVNGCTGGVGLAGLQIAKALKCKVTGVCSTKNLELAHEIGADDVIDYTKEDILVNKDTYDIFFDAVASQSFDKAKVTLKQNGTYITTLPSFQSLILGPIINIISTKKIKTILVKPSTKDLAVLKEMVESGKLIPVIGKIYPLNKVQEAHAWSETERVVGKLVLKII